MRPFRTLLLTAALALGAALPAAAQNVIFEGIAFTEFNEACEDFGWTGRPQFHVQFKPARLGGNFNRTRLTLFLRDYAQSYVVEGGPFTNRFQDVRAGGTGWETSFFQNQASLRVTRQFPATIRPATRRVAMQGVIRGWSDHPGCNATFHVHVVRRP